MSTIFPLGAIAESVVEAFVAWHAKNVALFEFLGKWNAMAEKRYSKIETSGDGDDFACAGERTCSCQRTSTRLYWEKVEKVDNWDLGIVTTDPYEI